jgi:hypothetical protein
VSTGAALDHLVVAARTLDEGVAWCEDTLGVRPEAGGRHALMGTHNRVFSIATAQCPGAYFELIAIDPDAPAPSRRRWFDLDDPHLHDTLAEGPRLIHWVMRCDDIDARCTRLARAGIDRGAPIAAERDTPQGLLRWRITVRDDGARLFDGALPTLIAWGERHPGDHLPPSGVALQALQLSGVPAAARRECDVPGVMWADDAPPLLAQLATPRGLVTLRSPLLGDAHVQP